MIEQMEDFGSRLRRVRELAGFSQEELSRRCGLTSRAISNLERGLSRPRANTTRLLARALGMDPAGAAEFHSMALHAGQHRPVEDRPVDLSSLGCRCRRDPLEQYRMSNHEALLMLHRLSPRSPAEWDPQVTETLLRACGGHMEAIRLLGAVLAVQPRFSLSSLAEQLSA